MLKITASSSSYYQFENLHLITQNRSHFSPSKSNTCHLPSITRWKISRISTKVANRTTITRIYAASNLPPAVPPVPSGSPFPQWSKWLLFAIIPMFFPFARKNWGPLIMFRMQMKNTVSTVGTMAESIEEVARKVDQMADNITEQLPQGSKLREVIEMMDKVAEETVKAADCVEDLLQKVEDAGENVENIIAESVKKKIATANSKVSKEEVRKGS
ncbi:hypothetical protein ACHQM5_023737 [Ranunculus cassubicifolius]